MSRADPRLLATSLVLVHSREAATQAQFGPEGPIPIARAWMEAVLSERDLRRAWALEKLTDELINPLSTDPLWVAFEKQLDEFQEKWSNVDLEHWGWAGDPRLEGIGREVVLLVDTSDPNVIDRGTHYEVVGDRDVPVHALGLIMEYVDAETDVETVKVDDETSVINQWRVADFYEPDAAVAPE